MASKPLPDSTFTRTNKPAKLWIMRTSTKIEPADPPSSSFAAASVDENIAAPVAPTSYATLLTIATPPESSSSSPLRISSVAGVAATSRFAPRSRSVVFAPSSASPPLPAPDCIRIAISLAPDRSDIILSSSSASDSPTALAHALRVRSARARVRASSSSES